jgi:hypothetical protein
MESKTDETNEIIEKVKILETYTPYKIILFDATGELAQIILFLGEEASADSESSKREWLDDDVRSFENVVFSPQSIHKDDSIRIIKKKILKEFLDQNRTVSYDELYLFGQMKTDIHLIPVYQDITDNDTKPVTQSILSQLFINLDIPDLAYTIETELNTKKKDYTFEELEKLDIFDKPQNIDVPVGMRFANRRQNYLFSTNPYNIRGGYDLVQPDDTENPMISFDNQLLLSFGELQNQTIYVCLAEQSFEYAIQQNISQEYIARTYYPFLAAKDIIGKTELVQRQPALIRETRKIMTPASFQLYDQVDMLYNIYYRKMADADLTYLVRGIQTFSFSLTTGASILFPMEVIFKNIHASLQIPFIKYNTGSRQENIYRLYCNRVSKNGRKIPFLTDTMIMRLSKTVGKTGITVKGSATRKIISLYLTASTSASSVESSLKELFMDIDRSGSIRIYGECETPIGEEALVKQIRTLVNPVIDNINVFLRPSGFALSHFIDLRQNTVDVLRILYQWKINIDKKLDLTNYRGCLSSIFDLVEGSDDLQKGIATRFKRVDNFKEMDAQNAFISEMFQQGSDKDEIIAQLIENYGLTEETAIVRLSDFVTQIAEVNGKIMESPGFPTLFQIPPGGGKTLLIQTDNIVSLEYIDVLSIYIDCILRMTQLPKSIPSDIMMKINSCKRSKIIVKDIAHVENVVAPIVLDKPAAILPLAFQLDEDEDEDFQQFMDFNASDNEEEDEGEDQDDFEGGQGPNEEEAQRNSLEAFEGAIDGMALHKPNPFEKRLKNYDPILFTTKLKGKYAEYSHLCNSNIKRQPVVLTQQEKEEIDRLYPGSYEHAIRYGSDKNHQNWYICPRYWCLLSNASMTEEDVRKGKCAKVPDPENPGQNVPDKVISADESKVPKGTYVYEFKSKTAEHIDKDGKYIPHYPGFLKEGLHPDGHCLPCCFKKFAKYKKGIPDNDQAERQAQCIPPSTTAEEGQPKIIAKRAKRGITTKETEVDYIKNAAFFPLEKERFGYLPISMQLFLQVDAKDFIDKNNPAIIEINKAALLRMGVEHSEKQSFLAAIANIYSHFKKLANTISIAEMREKLVDAISLDQFVKYHNGALVTAFKPKLIEQGKYDVDDYEGTEFVKDLESKEDDYYDLIVDTIASYEHFQDYLRDPNAEIDYTYLWDAVTQKNAKLFPNGINLVLLESTNHDITDNVRLICPTNQYSHQIYDAKRRTVILVKQGPYYEPVYLYQYYHETDPQTKEVKVRKSFRGYFAKEDDPQKYDEQMHNAKHYIRNLTMKVNRVLEVVQRSTKQMCAPKSSMPRIYEFERALPAEELYTILTAAGYTIHTQIANYQHNIIGLVVSKPEILVTSERIPLERLYIPCFPSSRLKTVPLKMMDAETKEKEGWWNDYSFTVAALKAVKRDTQNRVLSAPHSKIIEDNLVVGVLTETNQFIQVDPPSENIAEDDGLKEIRSSNYLVADKEIAYPEKADDDASIFASDEEAKRAQTVKNIAMESTFFTAFRTVIRRFLIDDFENRGIRDKLAKIQNNLYFTHKERLKKIAAILKEATREQIQFCEMDPKVSDRLTTAADLYSKLKSSGGENDTSSICLVSEDNTKIYFPKKHLISGLDNEEAYFMRVADEIIRYKRIQLFMLNSRYFLNSNYTEYVVQPDELILLQSLLTYEYFQGLIPVKENKYIYALNYDLALPLQTQNYSSEVSLEDQYQMNKVDLTAEQEAYELQCIQNTDPANQAVMGSGNKRDNIWNRAAFPHYAKELIMRADVDATFYPIIYILFKTTSKWHTVTEIRQKLVEAYRNYMDVHKTKIYAMWKHQGKYRMVVKIENRETTWEEVILSTEYGISNIDLWVLCDTYDIPVILFSSTKYKLYNLGIPVEYDWVVLNGSKGLSKIMKQNYFFIRGAGTKDPRAIASLHLIKPSIPLNEFKELSKRVTYLIQHDDTTEYKAHMSSLNEHLREYQVKELVHLRIEK